jgi:hypothetical protein
MRCLTAEQLAAIALELESDQAMPVHVHQCDACAAKLAEFARLSEQLSRLHTHFDGRHETARAELMARLTTAKPHSRTIPSRSLSAAVHRQMKKWQRVAVGGLALSAMAAVVLTMLSLGAPDEASAMQRMLGKLREVTSFQYSMRTRDTLTREGAEEPVCVDYVGTVSWQSPQTLGEEGPQHAHSEEGLIYEFPANSPPAEREHRMLSRFEVMIPAGEPGIVIDHRRECFIRVPKFRGDFGETSPVTRLRMVKDREGVMLRELGTKLIDGREAHGFVMRLAGAARGSGYDALNVWVDPETDLPLEIGYEVKADRGTQLLRIYDCRWNLRLDSQVFEAQPPEGYTDSTAPADQVAVNQMIAALALYAELSGGHYPRVEYFYGDEIHREMLEMAGFTGEPQEAWAQDQMFQRLQHITEGLDWLTRVLLSRPHARYFGRTVESSDKDKVLFWCITPNPGESFRVIYGNLETEVVEGDWYDRLSEGQSPRNARLPDGAAKNP